MPFTIFSLREDVGHTTDIHGNKSLLIAWTVLNVWPSHFGLPLLLGTILLSKKVYRHSTFINMCVTWIIDGLASSILLWTGHQTGPEPPKALCLAQASLLYGIPAMTSISAFALIYQVFSSLKNPMQVPKLGDYSLGLWFALVCPYWVWMGCAAAALAVGGSNFDLVSRQQNYFFCAVNSTSLNIFQTVLSALILSGTLALLVWISVILYKYWRARKTRGLKVVGTIAPFRVFRVLAFGIHAIVGIVLEVFAAQMGTSPVPHFGMATLGTGIILIFGTQPDILRAMCLWRHHESYENRTESGCPSRSARTSSIHSSIGKDDLDVEGRKEDRYIVER